MVNYTYNEFSFKIVATPLSLHNVDSVELDVRLAYALCDVLFLVNDSYLRDW